MQDRAPSLQADAIAVVGLSLRVPGANGERAFWANLLQGVESISRFSEEELLAAGVSREVIRQPNYVNARGVLEQTEYFDAQFFGYSADEATLLEPQQRVLLECAYHALENAAYDPDAYDGRIGLYAGASMNTYLLHHRFGDRLTDSLRWYQVRVGNDKDFLATRVSYKLNLVGPSMTVQTACSTSLAAVATACQSLLDYQCDIALAGGVSLAFPQKSGYLFHEGGITSPDGHCRAFSDQSRGCVGGEGVGLVVLQRLGEALASGAAIYGIIRGWAINNDGSAKVGYTAPSVAGQTNVIQEALAIADVDPASIGYVEGHGTGTPIGDPIEVSALTQAFRTTTDKRQFCGLGSVKTNIGHLDAAAGVIGLIKALLAVKHGVIPPSLHFNAPNPKLDLPNSPFYVPATATAWPGELSPRRAGVSSFGIGGTNVHVILEEPPSRQESGSSRPSQLLTISAATPSALDKAASQLADHLRLAERSDGGAAASFADLAHTLHVGRRSLPYRRTVACRDAAEAISLLTREPAPLSSGERVNAPPPVFFMFPGQRAQAPRMGSELYRSEPAYRRHFDTCADLLASAFSLDMRALLESGPIESADERAALFTVEYALARMWMEWGIKPAGMIGHEIGEYVVACLAEVLNLTDALRLVLKRSGLFAPALEETRLNRPRTRFISNVSGTWITDGEATSTHYWGRQVTETVRLEDGIRELLKVPAAIYLEAGPGSTLTSLVRGRPEATDRHIALCSLPDGDTADELRLVLETLGSCWVEGVRIDWPGFHADERRNRIALPGYPFERRPFLPDRLAAKPVADSAPAAEPQRDDSPPLLFYAPIWRQTAHARGRDESPRPHRWLILADQCGVAQRMEASLRERGDQLLIVDCGAFFEKVDVERYAVDYRDETSFDELVAALGAQQFAPDRVVHLWSLDDSSRKLGVDLLRDAHERGIGSLLFLIKAMTRGGWRHPMRVGVVTNEMQAVLGLSRHPEQATLVGLSRVVPMEYRHITCDAFDISLDDSMSDTASLLLGDLSTTKSEPCVAYRGGRRWALSYERVATPEPSGLGPLRRGGTYLITGGLGGIGVALAEYLSRTSDANLVLVTRSGSTDGADSNQRASRERRADGPLKRELLSRLERGRGRVLTLTADVTDPVQLDIALTRAEEEFGTIHGVIHAAGVPGAGLIRSKTFEELTRVFAPKIEGTVLLVERLDGKRLDFLILCSSLAAILGGVGQADYCAANAFLDAFAQSKATLSGCTTIALNWDRWIETGMAVNAVATSAAPLLRPDDEHPEHPLLDIGRRDGDEEVYTTYFSPRRHWVLEQHQVGDHAILPGTAFIELAAAAFGGGRAPEGPIELQDLYFLRPLRMGHEQTMEVRTILRRAAPVSTFRIVSIDAEDGTVTEHAGGTISSRARQQPEGETPPIAEPSVQPRELNVSQLLPVRDGWIVRGAKRLGPRWNVLRRVTSNETGSDLRAFLESSAEIAQETGEYYLDPALLDVATSFPLLSMIDADDDSYLALGFRRLALDGPLPGRISSQVRWPADTHDPATLHWDILLTDARGAEVGRVEQLTARRARDVAPEAVPVGDAQQGASKQSDEPHAQLVGLTAEQGAYVFHRALSGGLPQTLVSSQDLTLKLREARLAGADAVWDASPEEAASGVGDAGAGQSEVTAAVFAVWHEILGVPVEGPGDDFFELGGDSLLAVRLTARLREQLGVSLGVDTIFDQSTVGELCALVTTAKFGEQSAASHDTAAAT
jgi:acyl transferase domain-containing protein